MIIDHGDNDEDSHNEDYKDFEKDEHDDNDHDDDGIERKSTIYLRAPSQGGSLSLSPLSQGLRMMTMTMMINERTTVTLKTFVMLLMNKIVVEI